MRNSFLALLSGVILFIILAMSWCGRQPAQVGGSPTPLPTLTPTPTILAVASVAPTPTVTTSPVKVEPSATPAPTQTPSAELKKASAKIAPAVILVTTFDVSGKLVRSGPGFFATSDGRLITSWQLVQDAAHAVAKSPDGKIRNITGVIASSPALDLAVLKAETKTGVPVIQISKNSEAKGTAAIIGSSLGQREQPLIGLQINGREMVAGGDSLATSASLSGGAGGSPVIDENSEVVGIVSLTGEPNQPPRTVIRPADALNSLLAQTKSDSPAKWAAAPDESPSPSPSPKGKVVYAPSPIYPERARSFNPPLAGSGRFRIMFDATGQAKSVQIVRSTGQPILDQAAVEAFQKWKSTPGHEWSLLIPITFQPR